MRARPRWMAVAGAVALTALLAVYVWVAGARGVALIAAGSPVAVVLGVATLALPLLVVGLLAKEWRLAIVTQQMADELAAEGGLEVDDLPRSPGGRIDRAAARAAFDPVRQRAEAAPEDWRSWFRLAFAYDAAGDRRRARESLRHAARLRRVRP